MRKYLLAAIMAASALVPAAAFAQDQHESHDNRGGDRGGQPRGGGQRQAQAQAQQARPQQAQPQGQPQAQAQPQGQAPQAQRSQYGSRGYDGANRAQYQSQRGGDPRGFPGQPGGQPDQARVQAQGRDWQSGDRGGDRGGNGRDWQGDRGNQPRPGGAGWQGNDPHRDDRGGWQQGRRGNDRDGWQQGRGGYDRNPGWNGNRGGGDWNRGWRSDNRYNYFAYRNSNRGAFHLPRYYAPSGWGYGYRRFGIGLTLDSILYDQNYWIEDADYYRLPPAYGPYRWVRYYNDALLVDVETGEVVDTVYDIFW